MIAAVTEGSGGPTGEPPDKHPSESPGTGMGQVELVRALTPETEARMRTGPNDGADFPTRDIRASDTVGGKPMPTHPAEGAGLGKRPTPDHSPPEREPIGPSASRGMGSVCSMP